MIDALMYGSSTSSNESGRSAGVCTSTHSPLSGLHAVGDVRRGDEQVEVELALEPLADDLHVQEPEEAAAEAEAERLRRLGLVEERGVVQLQLLERVAQLGVVVGVGREEPGEHHRLDVLVARQRLTAAARFSAVSVSPTRSSDTSFKPGDHVADLAGLQLLHGAHRRRHEADLLRLEARAERHRAQVLARPEHAVDDADERDDAAVLVVRRVEDQRARRGVRVARWAPGSARRSRRAPRRRPAPSSPRCAGRCSGSSPIRSATSARRSVRVGLRQVDLVDDRDDLEVVLDREVGVRERLRLDPLRRVDDEERALARLQRPRDLVGEVDVAGRVDQVELVALPLRRAPPAP